jgi:hypothetical protein
MEIMRDGQSKMEDEKEKRKGIFCKKGETAQAERSTTYLHSYCIQKQN